MFAGIVCGGVEEEIRLLREDLTEIKIDIGIIKTTQIAIKEDQRTIKASVDPRLLKVDVLESGFAEHKKEAERLALKGERSTAKLYGGIGIMLILVQGLFAFGKYMLNGRLSNAG